MDGDATEVKVEFEYKDLAGGLSKIIVYYNGEGFPREVAKLSFGHLGESPKKHKRKTTTSKREVHGQEGKGRYKAITLGSFVKWKVCYLNDKKQKNIMKLEFRRIA